ncbi:MAG: YidC/Oxa1 family membrane protein insertase [Bacilli bacterium]
MKNNKKYLLLVVMVLGLLFLSGCSKNDTTQALGVGGFKFDDIFVYPMAGLMWAVSKTIGFANYGIVIILTTIVVRTLAWPIYAKTNDMSLKMSLVGPEAEKIKQKYAGKDDQQSQQRMQMETMQLYKKYGIGLGGCLMPLIQMPIFIGFFRTISRMPANAAVEGHWLNIFNTTEFFGINLLVGQEGSTWQKAGVITLAILVGLTQIFSLWISQRRQKKMKDETTSTVPDYRKPNFDQQKQTQKTMNIVMYSMTIMMVVFVLQSPAGLGLYWLVGNIYSTLQSYIGHKNSAKRLEVLKGKH